jgi:hypothetical protein
MRRMQMVTAEHVATIGVGRGTDPGQKTDPQTAQLQAIINLTDVLKTIAMVLIDIRDGKKAT